MPTTNTIDIKAAQVSGPLNFPKVRLIWKDGILHAYSANGLAFMVRSEKPVKRKGWITAWDAETVEGPLSIQGRCWTCGGHAKVAMKSVEKLMNGG